MRNENYNKSMHLTGENMHLRDGHMDTDCQICKTNINLFCQTEDKLLWMNRQYCMHAFCAVWMRFFFLSLCIFWI